MNHYLNKSFKSKIEQLENNNVHIWKIDLNKMQHLCNEYMKILNYDEKIRANKYRVENKKNLFILTRASLRLLLNYYLNTPYDIDLIKKQYGKLYINENKFYFNLSYTDDISIISFSRNSEIGIDLEKIKEDKNIIDISSKFFTKREINWIYQTSQENKMQRFLYCWVRKEAYIKALGLGLNLGLDTFHVIPKDYQNKLNNYFEINDWYLYPVDISNQYLASICLKNQKAEIEYFNFHEFLAI